MHLDGDGRNILGLFLLGGNVLPQRFEQRVRRSLVEKDSDDRQVAFGILMHKMCDQWEALPVHMLFTWVMKVKLFQGVDFVADRKGASGGKVHLDGVAVVDNVQGCRLVLQLQRGEISGLGVRDIDGRLGMSQGAR